MSKNEMIYPTHFLVPTVLSPSRTKTKGLNFFGSIKFGEGAKSVGDASMIPKSGFVAEQDADTPLNYLDWLSILCKCVLKAFSAAQGAVNNAALAAAAAASAA